MAGYATIKKFTHFGFTRAGDRKIIANTAGHRNGHLKLLPMLLSLLTDMQQNVDVVVHMSPIGAKSLQLQLVTLGIARTVFGSTLKVSDTRKHGNVRRKPR